LLGSGTGRHLSSFNHGSAPGEQGKEHTIIYHDQATQKQVVFDCVTFLEWMQWDGGSSEEEAVSGFFEVS
jgi:hypothetical protein